jgi:magnesium transporter
LQGEVPLHQLMRAQRTRLLSDLKIEEEHRIEALEVQEDVAQLFQRYNLVSAAVVDTAGRLVGVMTIDDIVDVLQEEADADIKALGGVNADEELSDTVAYIAKSRFVWLFINLITALMAASVLDFFSHSLEKMVALAILAPIVASQGGNAATQTMTVAVRALATRELGTWNMARFVRRELLVGVFNGVAFAVLTGGVAALWFMNLGLAWVIGGAMFINLIAAALAGLLIPVLLEKFNYDPAVASAPFVTTVTDVIGFFAFLGIAVWWFAL